LYGASDTHRQSAIQKFDPCVLVLHAWDVYHSTVKGGTAPDPQPTAEKKTAEPDARSGKAGPTAETIAREVDSLNNRVTQVAKVGTIYSI